MKIYLFIVSTPFADVSESVDVLVEQRNNHHCPEARTNGRKIDILLKMKEEQTRFNQDMSQLVKQQQPMCLTAIELRR
ncbi:unnamed protein product, partial [Rotaria sp. Silwood2]